MPVAVTSPVDGVTDEQWRLFRHVDLPENLGECWVWTAATNDDGYGIVVADHRCRLVHRRSWEVFVGAIPAGMVIDHTCHNTDLTCPGGPECIHRACINPDHLEPVTQQENIRRAAAQRRAHRRLPDVA